jgi:hypothetical protein
MSKLLGLPGLYGLLCILVYILYMGFPILLLSKKVYIYQKVLSKLHFPAILIKYTMDSAYKFQESPRSSHFLLRYPYGANDSSKSLFVCQLQNEPYVRICKCGILYLCIVSSINNHKNVNISGARLVLFHHIYDATRDRPILELPATTVQPG